MFEVCAKSAIRHGTSHCTHFKRRVHKLLTQSSRWNSNYPKFTSRNLVLNDLSKKIVNVHNDGINVYNDLIPSLWTFTIFLDKSFRTSFSTSDYMVKKNIVYQI